MLVHILNNNLVPLVVVHFSLHVFQFSIMFVCFYLFWVVFLIALVHFLINPFSHALCTWCLCVWGDNDECFDENQLCGSIIFIALCSFLQFCATLYLRFGKFGIGSMKSGNTQPRRKNKQKRKLKIKRVCFIHAANLETHCVSTQKHWFWRTNANKTNNSGFAFQEGPEPGPNWNMLIKICTFQI